MKGQSNCNGGRDYRLWPGGLLDATTYDRLGRLCILSPFPFFMAAGLNGPDGMRPDLLAAVQEVGPLLTPENRDYWTGRGLVIADAAGRVRVGGVEEEIDGLQAWLSFRHGCRLVSPVLGEPWRWFRIHREELARRAEKAGRKALYEAAERHWDSRPLLPRIVRGRAYDLRPAPGDQNQGLEYDPRGGSGSGWRIL